VAKKQNLIDIALMEFTIREDLNKRAPRVMGVLNPLKVVITNYSVDITEKMEALNNPEDESQGKREVPFTREIYIDRDDFMEDPPKKFFRLAPGREVRLRYGYYLTCTDVIKDEQGRVIELHGTYDPESHGGKTPDGRKVRGTIHWVSAAHALNAEVRLYDRLFNDSVPDTGEDADLASQLNPDSLKVLTGCKLEPSLADAEPGSIYQFERLGYFCVDTVDSKPGTPIFNRTVTLRDTWAKMQKK
jgi:glutaminyl-tRNA synthetase